MCELGSREKVAELKQRRGDARREGAGKELWGREWREVRRAMTRSGCAATPWQRVRWKSAVDSKAIQARATATPARLSAVSGPL